MKGCRKCKFHGVIYHNHGKQYDFCKHKSSEIIKSNYLDRDWIEYLSCSKMREDIEGKCKQEALFYEKETNLIRKVIKFFDS